MDGTLDLTKPLDSSRKFGKHAKKLENPDNPLLVHHEVGKSKKSVYTLPGPDFSYGKPSIPDPENARDVILNWQEHKKNPDTVPGRDFIALNRMSLKDRVINPKDVSNYRKTHDARLRTGHRSPSRTDNPSRSQSSLDNMVFGMRTKFDTPVKDLIENKYEYDWVKEKIIEDGIRQMEESLTRTKQRSINRSLTRTRARSTSPNADRRRADTFKMKRFQNIPSKIDMGKTHSNLSTSGSVTSTNHH